MFFCCKLGSQATVAEVRGREEKSEWRWRWRRQLRTGMTAEDECKRQRERQRRGRSNFWDFVSTLYLQPNWFSYYFFFKSQSKTTSFCFGVLKRKFARIIIFFLFTWRPTAWNEHGDRAQEPGEGLRKKRRGREHLYTCKYKESYIFRGSQSPDSTLTNWRL